MLGYTVIRRLDERRLLVRFKHSSDLTIIVDKKKHRPKRTSENSVYNRVGSALHRLMVMGAA